MEGTELLQLPESTDWVPRFGRPCGGCGALVFSLIKVRRRFTTKGQPDEIREAVESRCPTCPLLSDRNVIQKTLLGRHDLKYGRFQIHHTTET